MLSSSPRTLAVLLAGFTLSLLLAMCFLRARRSRYPALLHTCAAYMILLHAVWIGGLLSSQLFESGFATLLLLTFPWSAAVVTNMTMVGFDTAHDLLLNYARFVLGFGGIQCLLLTLFVWELRLKPRTGRGGRLSAKVR